MLFLLDRTGFFVFDDDTPTERARLFCITGSMGHASAEIERNERYDHMLSSSQVYRYMDPDLSW